MRGGNSLNGESDRVSATELRLVRELFPFCFLVGHDYQVVMTGDRLAQFDDRARVGVSFAELFEIERPTGIAGEADILTRLGEVFILKLRARPTLQLRGQFVRISANDDRSGLLFVGGPWINKITELAPLGLELADFPPHDPRGDLLILLQTHESTLADLKLLTVRLRATGAALAERTSEIERELQLRTELEAQLRQSQRARLEPSILSSAHFFIFGFILFNFENIKKEVVTRETTHIMIFKCKCVEFFAYLSRTSLKLFYT